jgi:multiple antibiotic resistance protein
LILLGLDRGSPTVARHEERTSFEGSLIVPYAIPFVAGPGAITAVITIASSASSGEGVIAALVAVGVAVALMPLGYLVLAPRINRPSAAWRSSPSSVASSSPRSASN